MEHQLDYIYILTLTSVTVILLIYEQWIFLLQICEFGIWKSKWVNIIGSISQHFLVKKLAIKPDTIILIGVWKETPHPPPPTVGRHVVLFILRANFLNRELVLQALSLFLQAYKPDHINIEILAKFYHNFEIKNNFFYLSIMLS